MILEQIAKETGVAVDKLLMIVRTANYRYKTYSIPKRTGGYRQICHPTPEIKFLQRWMIRNLFVKLPVHDAVTSYRIGRGVAQNAQPHVRQNYLLKIDFTDFFPSITNEDIRLILAGNAALFTPTLTAEDVEVILSTVCKDGRLTIGAPSSPVLSNAILYDFDCFVHETCCRRDIVYTRYADDLFMSTNGPDSLSRLLETIRENLDTRPFPSLTINDRKTVFTSRKRRRVVTGLVLTPDYRLSIGREKKRQIRTMIHLYGNGNLPTAEISYLRGYLAYVSSVEPEFIARVRRKYGDDILDRLTHEDLVRRKPA